MFYKHTVKKKKKTIGRSLYFSWKHTIVANLHLSRTAWRCGRELLQLKPFIHFTCFNVDLGSSRAPQRGDGELRFVGPRPRQKHPDQVTQPLCLAFPLLQTLLGVFLVLTLPLLQSIQAGTTFLGSWHKRAPDFTRLERLPSYTQVFTTSPTLIKK